jgi:hypothetical protein
MGSAGERAYTRSKSRKSVSVKSATKMQKSTTGREVALARHRFGVPDLAGTARPGARKDHGPLTGATSASLHLKHLLFDTRYPLIAVAGIFTEPKSWDDIWIRVHGCIMCRLAVEGKWKASSAPAVSRHKSMRTTGVACTRVLEAHK